MTNIDEKVYEEDVLRNRFVLKAWLRYYERKQQESYESRLFVLERAVKELPRSYKLWKLLLDLRMDRLLLHEKDSKSSLGIREPHPDFPPSHPEWLKTNDCFERSLVLCNKFPVIWRLYLRFLISQQHRLTFTRRAFDRALKALPYTQHKSIWKLYLVFAQMAGGETFVRVWRRYLAIEPQEAEVYAAMLLDMDPPKVPEAVRMLATIVANPRIFGSIASGKTTFQYWTELCDLICSHPSDLDRIVTDNAVPVGDTSLVPVGRLDVEKMIRTGINRFKEQVGRLWTSLAMYWLLKGRLEHARDIFEQALRQVTTVRDFSVVFDAYAKMEEDIIAKTMENLTNQQFSDEQLLSSLDGVDLDLRLARLEKLVERRPFLVNDVLLRQNPHNVKEWANRANLYVEAGDPEKAVETYEKAVETISPHRAHGKLCDLWIEYAKYYEDKSQIKEARSVFERAVAIPFKLVDDLAAVWCQWAEFEIRHDEFEAALDILGRATTPPRGTPAFHATIRFNDDSKTSQQRLFKSNKLWAFYVDLEESLGTTESTKAVYDRILELKIATPQIIINYASFLEENKYFEESFRVYERGVELFGYPIAFEIWNLYLTKFIARYGGTKMERTRDLFEHALENCPPKFAKTILLLYAKLEEDHGLTRHAMRIYDRATRVVNDEDRGEMFDIYIAKATSFFGLVSTREIYQRALETLPDKKARDIAMRFAAMETKLGEVDRSRTIFAYGSQLCDPRMDPEYWKAWHEFEVKYGNEDTFKEMLRIKRSVQAKFNTEVGFISSQILAAKEKANSVDDGTAVEANRAIGFVRAKTTEPKDNDEPVAADNPDEIEIDDDDEDIDLQEEAQDLDEKGVDGIQRQPIPDAVFGSLGNKIEETEAESNLGAKDRFKRKR